MKRIITLLFAGFVMLMVSACGGDDGDKSADMGASSMQDVKDKMRDVEKDMHGKADEGKKANPLSYDSKEGAKEDEKAAADEDSSEDDE